MFGFLRQRYGKISNFLVVTEINRDSMSEYTEAYLNIFKKENIKVDRFNFLENDKNLKENLINFMGKKHYDFVFLLSGAVGSAEVANVLNDQKTVFIGTENFGSYELPSFYLLLNNKKIKSFFIRNISFLNPSKNLLEFEKEYTKFYGESPAALSAYTYDAMNIILLAIKNEKSLRDKSMLDIDYQGVTGITIKNNYFSRSKYCTILSITPSGYKYEA
jgi:hypothetical protein